MPSRGQLQQLDKQIYIQEGDTKFHVLRYTYAYRSAKDKPNDTVDVWKLLSMLGVSSTKDPKVA